LVKVEAIFARVIAAIYRKTAAIAAFPEGEAGSG
jgi:hypothetical protein